MKRRDVFVPITLTIPHELRELADQRIAGIAPRRKVGISGLVEAALREVLAMNDDELVALMERYDIPLRRRQGRRR